MRSTDPIMHSSISNAAKIRHLEIKMNEALHHAMYNEKHNMPLNAKAFLDDAIAYEIQIKQLKGE